MKRWYRWCLILVLYVLFIYSNSMKPDSISSLESGEVLHTLRMFCLKIGIPAAGLTEHLIRKAAHFTEYTLLGLLLYRNGVLCPWKPEVKRFSTVILGFLIPFIDETIQLFVKGRSGQISDVWLDMSGICFGLIVGTGLVWAGKRRHNEKL